MLEKLLRVTRLLETYSGLLPRKQAAMCAAYYLDNLSLGEIAENEGISRQAVHDSIERAIDLDGRSRKRPRAESGNPKG
ncbi:MAG: hypothetical protein MZU79_03375 [Anaerotruncus sp.]|nr:hypothetical protein [Anaerotruncus sp.]